MSKIAYLQCPTGIAGDMFLGALVSAGVPLDFLIENLSQLNLTDEYQLREEKVVKNGQSATKVHVDLTHHSHHHHSNEHSHQHSHHHNRHLPEIKQLIEQTNLPLKVKENSIAIFEKLAIAEASVHGTTKDQVHFHEVGATDALVDIVGTCIGLDYLQVEKLYCSPLPTGGGTVKAEHGVLPVPVPAVLELWQSRNVPVYSNGIEKELVTPTGAAIVTTLATDFGQPPSMSLNKIGLGAGNRNLIQPNILRLWLGEAQTDTALEEVVVLETQIDDCNPQIYGYLLEELLKIGARDVFTQPVAMKKNRPGVLLTVICDLNNVEQCEAIIFTETTTIGIRRQIQSRSILNRKIKTISTPYGDVRVKIASKAGTVINIQPEYDDCVILARQSNLPFSTIFTSAQQIAQQQIIVNNDVVR